MRYHCVPEVELSYTICLAVSYRLTALTSTRLHAPLSYSNTVQLQFTSNCDYKTENCMEYQGSFSVPKNNLLKLVPSPMNAAHIIKANSKRCILILSLHTCIKCCLPFRSSYAFYFSHSFYSPLYVRRKKKNMCVCVCVCVCVIRSPPLLMFK
jgi:hypothetical protein